MKELLLVMFVCGVGGAFIAGVGMLIGAKSNKKH